MVHGRSMTCAKYLLFIFNFLFVICGLCLIIIGALATKRDLTLFMGNKYITAPYVIIVVGCMIFVVAFFGCCGAIRENHCMVTTFGLLVFIIFIAEVAGGISAYLYRGQVEDFLINKMNTSLNRQSEDSVKIWDAWQTRFECCGVFGPADYTTQKIHVPKSCCKDKEEKCTEETAFLKGCYGQLLDKINSSLIIIGGVAVGLAIIELLGVIFAWCLASAIKRDLENN